MRHKRILIITLFMLLLSLGLAQAQSAEIDAGLGYLATVQNTDGSWGSVSSSTDALTAATGIRISGKP